jgi:hypothetical protein
MAIISIKAIAKITNSELVNGRLVYKAILKENISMTQIQLAQQRIHPFITFLVTGFERISNSAGKPIKRP